MAEAKPGELTDMEIIGRLAANGYVQPPIVGSASGANLLEIKLVPRGGKLTVGLNSYWARKILDDSAMFVVYCVDKKAFSEEKSNGE